MSKQSLGGKDQARNEAEGLTNAENYIKEACKILQKEAARLRQEQEAIDSMSKKLDRVHFSSKINLDVAGHLFKTSVQTLTKDPNSMLAAMFSGRFEMKPSEDGSFFIDRDGTHFRFILNYLRTGKLILPEGATFLKELEEEAEFYQIQGIIDELKVSKPSTIKASKPSKAFEESEILTNDEHRSVLKSWLPRQDRKWRLLFRASRDGFAAETFHSKCDNKGATVTIVKSGNNIFGGFTEKSWTSQLEYTRCRDAFLFSMINPQGLGPTKMQLKSQQQQYAIYCFSGCGPTFGGGHDLHISDNANTNTESYSILGSTYECPPGQQSTFFTGVTVTNYEVFALQM
ncbi:hypothetical protein ACROYT_G042313 [Oculina patagonica]